MVWALNKLMGDNWLLASSGQLKHVRLMAMADWFER